MASRQTVSWHHRAVTEAAGGGLEEAVARVGDRWTLLLVEALLRGPRRFGELQAGLPAIAPNVLSRRLRQLEADGLVVTRSYSERPPRVEYHLTAEGTELAGALRLLAQWGAARSPATAATLHHETCGTDLSARWWCPTCARVVDDDEASQLHHL
jgi:DNA-binding HxlR family transcriptional regulator